MASHLLVFQLSGGPPYGLRLQGGLNDSPFVIAKIRAASKAEAVGLQEGDVMIAVNGVRCRGLTHDTITALMDLHPHVLTAHVMRGGGIFDVEASERSLASQMTVLTEAEASALVAKRPDAGSSSSYAANIGSTSSSLLHSSSPPLQLQQPPFKLRGLDRVAPSVVISADELAQPQYGGVDADVQPTSTYRRQEQTSNDDDGRTQRHTVEERETHTHGSGDGGSLSRTTTTSRRQVVSYSHTDSDLHQQPLPWDRTFKDDVTGAVDWFGERSEDRTRHSLVTEARGGGYDPARQQGPRQEPAAPLNDSVTQQTTAVDQIRAGPASRPQTHHSGPEFEASVGPAPPPAGPVHIIHAGAHSTLPGYENATPLYEADIRPGQSLVMPGFTISIEAARGPQQAAADGPAPVVTVIPAGEVGYRATVGNQDPSPRHPQEQHHYQQQQQQQPMSEYHPLAGVMRGQQTRQQFDADQAVYREPERQTARLAEQQDWPVKTVPHQHPTSLPHPAHHPGAVRYGNQPVAAEAVARQSEGELVDQQRAWTDSRVWGPHHGQMMVPHHGQVMPGSERQATFTETQPAIDNVQVSVGSQSYFSVRNQPQFPARVDDDRIQPGPQRPIEQIHPPSVEHHQPAPYQSQPGGPQSHRLPQSSLEQQPSLPYHGQAAGPPLHHVPQFSAQPQIGPYQSQVPEARPPQQMPQAQQPYSPYHGQAVGPPSYQSATQTPPYDSRIPEPQPHQMPQFSPPRQQFVPYDGQAGELLPRQLPQRAVPYQSHVPEEPKPTQVPQFSPPQQQVRPHQSQVRPMPPLAAQRFAQPAAGYGGIGSAPAQRPPSLVSHKLPLNPHFNRELLADIEPQPHNHAAHTVDNADLSAQYLTEPYQPHHGQVQFGGVGPSSGWNQPPADAVAYPAAPTAATWHEQYGGEFEEGGYPGRGMYVEENGGYHSLPRTMHRTTRPAPPPPPPPPDPFKVYGLTSSGGGDPERRNLEKKVMMANSLAQSFTSPDNINSPGQRMFLLRRQHSEKWTTSGPDPVPEDVVDHRQQQWGDGEAWPAQGAPAGHHPPPVRPQSAAPRHYLPSGPVLGRSISVEGPMAAAQHHQRAMQFPPRVAAPGPHGFLRGPAVAAPQFPPGPAAKPREGYLRPVRPLPDQGGAGAPPPMRHRSESFGGLSPGLRPGPAMQHHQGVVQQWDWHSAAGQQQQYPQQMMHWPASSASAAFSSQPQRVVSGLYGLSDL